MSPRSRLAIIFLCCLFYCHQCYTFTVDPSVCRQAKKCGECQGASPECSWCSDQNFQGNRCDRYDFQGQASCQDVVFQQSRSRVTQAEPLSNQTQLSPQRLSLSLYNGRPVSFEVSVTVPPSRNGYRNMGLRTRSQGIADVDVEMTSTCSGFRHSASRWLCPRVRTGETVRFTVKLTLRRCGDKSRTKIRIKASGIRGNIRVDLFTVCSWCSCEFYSLMASGDLDEECNENGAYLCGLCDCFGGYHGERCECETRNSDTQCTSPWKTEVCSGRGECICGECDCGKLPNSSNASFTGRFCECDDYSCPFSRGMICGGSQRGECKCGQCQCRSGFAGDGCGMSLDTTSCVSSNGLLCNGHGMCVDATCHCDGRYSGPVCEDCPTCPT